MGMRGVRTTINFLSSKVIANCGAPIPLFLTIGAVVCIGVLLHSQAKYRKVIDRIAKEVVASREATEEILAWQRIRPVTGLSVATIGGKRVKVLDGPIDFKVDVATATSVRGTRAGWMPSSPEELPVPWPILAHKPHVMPYEFAQILSIYAHKIEEGRMVKDAVQIRRMLGTLEEHSRVSSDRASFIYDYDLEEFDGFVAKGWRSAFGDAAVVMGLCELYEATRDPALMALARKYAASLVYDGKNTDTLYVDRAGYLWFEEYPPIEKLRTHVLNGHIFTTFALIRLSYLADDRSYEPLIRAGLATSARHILDSRNPGGRSSYNLGGKRYPDYGPERMILFAKTLKEITGNPIFAAAEVALTTDE